MLKSGQVMVLGYYLSLFLALLVSSSAFAQEMPNYCGAVLDTRASPSDTADWRMRCTIQKLVAERANAEDKATQFEVNLAVAEAHLHSVQNRVDEIPKLEEYWKKYSEALKWLPDLSAAIDETCSWRGTFNEPTAKMCKLWRQK